MSHISYLILGSNLGDREELLKRAAELIDSRAGKILNSSSIYETEPWNGREKSKIKRGKSKFYLNQVLKILTELTPQELMGKLTDIEKELGRERETNGEWRMENGKTYKPRTIDIDILFYDDIIQKSRVKSQKSKIKNQLNIPHLLLHKRKFVLVPLCEIASDFIHPVLKVSMKQLLDECDDENEVRKVKSQKKIIKKVANFCNL